MGRAYGVQHGDPCPDDPVEDVCRQVLFHEQHARRQRALLPRDRLWVISYEEFCRHPGALVARVLSAFPGIAGRVPDAAGVPPFAVANRTQVSDAERARMRRRLAELGAGRVECESLTP
jgi:hypothetical protein